MGDDEKEFQDMRKMDTFLMEKLMPIAESAVRSEERLKSIDGKIDMFVTTTQKYIDANEDWKKTHDKDFATFKKDEFDPMQKTDIKRQGMFAGAILILSLVANKAFQEFLKLIGQK
jgi:hypothetical protein